MINLKEKLYQECVNYVAKREQTVAHIINSNKKALESETKSSAGDKHETGRAMLQLEMEKASQQLAGIQQMKDVLLRMSNLKSDKIACLGSVVITNTFSYFLSISAGELLVDGKKYYAISTASPIGKMLLGKIVGSEIIFNKTKIIIKDVY